MIGTGARSHAPPGAARASAGAGTGAGSGSQTRTGTDALVMRDVRVWLPSGKGQLKIIRNATFTVGRGQVVAIAGESGSGKSTSIMAALRLLPPGARIEGQILLDGVDVLAMPRKRMRELRAQRARLVFQDPWRALHPIKKIGTQLVESARTADPTLSKAAARELATEMLATVGIPEPKARMASYSHEISGGQAQRIVIAMALVARPAVLFCDEPTTALDVTIQAQILELLRRLSAEFGISIVIATHDLDVIADVTDRLVVMYAGQVVEEGPTAEVLAGPRHPYTWALLRAAPGAPREGNRLQTIEGRPPAPSEELTGCAFAPRCASALPVCRTVLPEPRLVAPGRVSACIRAAGYGPLAPRGSSENEVDSPTMTLEIAR